MREEKEKICVLGGLYFVFGYLFNQMQDLFNSLSTYGFFEFMASCLGKLSVLLDIIFVILFFVMLFGKKIAVLQRFMDKYPKSSVYFYCIGFIGYILFALDVLILAPTEFIALGETTQKYITISLACINIAGVIIALVWASYDIYFRRKKDEKTK